MSDRKPLVEASPAQLSDAQKARLRGDVRFAYTRDQAMMTVATLEVDGLLNEIEALQQFRALLWWRHDCERRRPGALYGDDGELQCHACGVDFKRMSAAQINDLWQRQGLDALPE